MAELKIIQGENTGKSYSLSQNSETIIGRSKKAAVTLPSSKVSGKHAKIWLKEGTWILQDLESTNGTFVNGRRVSRVVLNGGERIKIGANMFAFFSGESPQKHESNETDQGTSAQSATEESLDRDTQELKKATKRETGPGALEEAAERLHNASEAIREKMGEVIVGQEGIIEDLLTALFARGHVLLVGVPGLAKTLMVRTLAGIMDLSFRRIQFTPDLMPSDITGTDILQEDQSTGSRSYKFLKGPVFTNVLLGDEINRTPPKTQAALLEAMQEYRVTASGRTYELPLPFFVLATQNPIEQEGTYPLPEAQLDRFMFNSIVDYPSRKEEVAILQSTTVSEASPPEKVLASEEITACQALVRELPVSNYIFLYAADLVRASRPGRGESPDFVDRFVAWGAGPRAAQYLVLGAKVKALLKGRLNVSINDIKSVAHPVLRHRIFLNFHADSEGLGVDGLIDRLLDTVPEPKADDLRMVED